MNLRVQQTTGWHAAFPRDRLAGPRLELDERPLVLGGFCEINELPDARAIVDEVRAARQSNIHIVRTSGSLPFGAELGFRHVHRCGPGFLRLTTDLHIQPTTTIRGPVYIGCLELPDSFGRYRLIVGERDGQVSMTAWRPLAIGPLADGTDGTPAAVLGMVVDRNDGRQLEVGLGDDIWRWQRGLDDTDAAVTWTLAEGPGGPILRRTVGQLTGERQPRPRDYRFSMYLSWSGTAALPTPAQPAVWTPDGDLVVARLPRDEAVAVNFAEMPLPAALRRHAAGAALSPACFAAPGVVKRVKRVIRQLMTVSGPVQLLGLTPGPCDCGAHLGRRRQLPHWDLPNLLELAAWVRQALGPDREICAIPGSCGLPSSGNLFPLQH